MMSMPIAVAVGYSAASRDVISPVPQPMSRIARGA